MQLAAVVLLSCLGSWQAPKVGVVDPRALVIAFYRSELWRNELKARREEMEAAKRAGDRRKAAELERWGREAQRLAHRQLAGKAPLDNIWNAIAPLLPEIAAKAGVEQVVPESPPGVEAVDVTPLLLDALGTDETTRRWIERMQEKSRRPPPGRAVRKGKP